MNHAEATALLQAYYGFPIEAAQQCARTIKPEKLLAIKCELQNKTHLENSKIITA